MQPMPQSICAIVCIYVYFGPTQRLLPGVTTARRRDYQSSSKLFRSVTVTMFFNAQYRLREELEDDPSDPERRSQSGESIKSESTAQSLR